MDGGNTTVLETSVRANDTCANCTTCFSQPWCSLMKWHHVINRLPQGIGVQQIIHLHFEVKHRGLEMLERKQYAVKRDASTARHLVYALDATGHIDARDRAARASHRPRLGFSLGIGHLVAITSQTPGFCLYNMNKLLHNSSQSVSFKKSKPVCYI